MSEVHRPLRDALGQFATGVCLVTVTDSAGVAHAVTVNSFSSVSLDPPLVLWSLQNASDIYALYADAPRFAIAVLREEQHPLSTSYAARGGHLLAPEHHSIGENGAPLVTGALVNFECELAAAHEGGDHRILIGRITRVVEGERGRPLLFFGGSYGKLG